MVSHTHSPPGSVVFARGHLGQHAFCPKNFVDVHREFWILADSDPTSIVGKLIWTPSHQLDTGSLGYFRIWTQHQKLESWPPLPHRHREFGLWILGLFIQSATRRGTSKPILPICFVLIATDVLLLIDIQYFLSYCVSNVFLRTPHRVIWSCPTQSSFPLMNSKWSVESAEFVE